ncbi:MAG TPA: cobalamin biosynthesis bifunctional protein CbiET [Ruminococcaceae bacterium]|nr:cobalamin biosynthesis bifunctional protein CbiET [Oscillospiraceae bacterium]
MKITLVGIGMGNPETLTIKALDVLQQADCIIGGKRMLESLPAGCTNNRIEGTAPQKIADIIKSSGCKSIAVALSGDTGFYSGASKLAELLKQHKPDIICGISSVQYLASKLMRPWQNIRLVSAHGVDCNIVAEVLNYDEVFFLTGGKITAEVICSTLCNADLGCAHVVVGENLSYPDENITTGTAAELANKSFSPLSAVMVKNEKKFSRSYVTQGIADDEFVRGDTPMTKQEVRSVILAKLKLRQNDIAYDIGAGTGSVSVEMALAARFGSVYAIECEKAACELIEKNKIKFGAYNLTCINGFAPQALAGLPIPDAVFIGGSKGNLAGIINSVLAINPNARIAISAVTLETQAEAINAIDKLNLPNASITQISVSRASKVGRYHMLKAENPISIISIG